MRHANTITLTIHTDGAAFDDHEGAETARILRTLARSLSQYRKLPTTATPGDGFAPFDSTARDDNGNTCGRLQIMRADRYAARRDTVRDALPDTDSAAHRALDVLAD